MMRAFLAITALLYADGARKIKEGLKEGLGEGFEEGLEEGLEKGSGESLEESFTRTQVNDMEWDHFRAVNRARRRGFTCPNGRVREPVSRDMVFDCPLWRAARLHSEDMTRRCYGPSHTGADGSSFDQRARRQGTTAQGENIAARGRAATPDAFVTQFLNSNSHCWLMGGPNHRTFGGGYAIADNGCSPISTMTQLFSHRHPDTIADNSCIRGRSLDIFNDTEEDDEEQLLIPSAVSEDDERTV